MKTKLMIAFSLLGIISLTSVAQTSPMDYFGQTPPGNIPKKFSVYPTGSLPQLHSSPSFSPSGDEAFWATWPDMSNFIQTVYYRKKENGNWSNPSIAPFSGGKYSDKLPCFSGDGERVYFTSDRPLSGSGATIDENIWYIEKNASGWSSPIPLDNSVNSSQDDAWISVAANNNLYFGRNNKLYFAKWEQNHFLPAQELAINIQNFDNQGCIAPDESYIILQSVYVESSPGIWVDDLYIIFQDNGVWQKPIKLDSKINSMKSKSFVQITPDGEYLIFLGDNGSAYWVSTAFVGPLKLTTGINGMKNNEKKITLYPNPTTGQFSISFGSTPKLAVAEIYNTEGKMVLTNTFRNAGNAAFDLTGYPKGIYLVKVALDGKMINEKICLE